MRPTVHNPHHSLDRMMGRLTIALVLSTLTACLPRPTPPNPPEPPPPEGEACRSETGGNLSSLLAGKFAASGQGNATTLGVAAAGASSVNVQDVSTWCPDHGVRIERAGPEGPREGANAGWTPLDDQARAAHLSLADAEAGVAVKCSYTGSDNEEHDLCGKTFATPQNFGADELALSVRVSKRMPARSLQLVLVDVDGETSKARHSLPELSASSEWTALRLSIRGENRRQQIESIRLRCRAGCAGLEVWLDHLSVHTDYVGQVTKVEPNEDGGGVLQLKHPVDSAVDGTTVRHDDTRAISSWLDNAQRHHIVDLEVPAGTYNISRTLTLRGDTHIRCASPTAAVFRNAGRSKSGTAQLFLSDGGVANVEIQGCGFDGNGWNASDFGAGVIGISGPEVSQQIVIRGNRFFDSVFDAQDPVVMDCDQGQDACEILQRQYVLVLNADGVWIEDNDLSGGGRIKAGRPGRNIFIRRNQINLVNDNAITIVDRVGTCERRGCLTENVEITNNKIHNAVGAAIFLGVDGECSDGPPGVTLRNVTVRDNQITGFAHSGLQATLPQNTERILIRGNSFEVSFPRPRPGFPAGIVARRANNVTRPSQGVTIAQNQLVLRGSSSAWGTAGILVAGRHDHVSLSENEVRCEGCGGLSWALRLRGEMTNVTVQGNQVSDASRALFIENAVEAAVVTDNVFTGSHSDNLGQIHLAAADGRAIRAWIADNQVSGGAGWGISCGPSGEYGVALVNNSVTDNARGEVLRCSTVLPDMVATVSGPAVLRRGKDPSCYMNLSIQNIGGSPAPPGYVIDTMLSTDTTLPDGLRPASASFLEDALVKNGRVIVNQIVGVGQTVQQQTAGKLPNDTPPGHYCMGYSIDAGDAVSESDETNNKTCHHFEVTIPEP